MMIPNTHYTMKSVAKKDEAVSPVIGTILLVAITVVLVAIVAAVVMGMVGGMGETKNVGATTTAADGYIIATITGGPDVTKLHNFSVSVTGPESSSINSGEANHGSALVGQPVKLGTGNKAENPLKAGTYSVIVTGNFTDSTAQVLSTGTITVGTSSTNK
ncbi:MAG: type IV pilin [Methanocorpusculum sp.]|nr:type IV pilin [Methanocorpusculum sp.]